MSRPDWRWKLNRVAGDSRKLATDLDISEGGVNGTTRLGGMMCTNVRVFLSDGVVEVEGRTYIVRRVKFFKYKASKSNKWGLLGPANLSFYM